MYSGFPAPHGSPFTAAAFLEGYVWMPLVGAYFICAFLMSKIAYKTGPNGCTWWAYIPVLNTILLIRMAGRPLWWFWLLLVPGVNVIAFCMLWIGVARRLGLSDLWGFLVILPLVNLAALLMMAYGERRFDYGDPLRGTPGDPPRSRRTG